jgi:hypothetical protein
MGAAATTAVIAVADITGLTEAITGGVADIGVIRVMDTDGDSGLDLDGRTGGDTTHMHIAMLLILTIIRTTVPPAIRALITETIHLLHQIPAHGPGTPRKIPQDLLRQQDLRTTRPVKARMTSRVPPLFLLTG